MGVTHEIRRAEAQSATALRLRQARSWLAGRLRRWDFWLALALAAALRLWHSERALTLGDQTDLLALARLAVVHATVPVTSNLSSIGTMNPPLSVYLLVPIALVTANPLPQVVALALWNVAGVGLCYALAARSFGRTAAAWSSLLFAVCTSPVHYSRFLWQPNYIAPLLALWLWTLVGGVRRPRRGWFVANVTLLALAALLHSTAALLAPATVVAWLLSPRRPRWGEYALTAGALALLAAPTLIWERYSHFSDAHVARHYLSYPSHTDLDVLQNIYIAFGSLGQQPAPAVAQSLITIVAYLTCALLGVGLLALTVRVVAGLPRHIRALLASPLSAGELWRRFDALRRSEAHGAGRWRAFLVLWLAVTVPVVYLIHHTSPVYPHYLIVLYPSAFLVFGLTIQWATAYIAGGNTAACSAVGGAPAVWREANLARRRRTTLRASTLALSLALVGLAGVIVVGQMTQTMLYLAAIEGPQFHPYFGYGYPLDTMLRADQTLDQLQRQVGATHAVVLANATDYHRNLTHLLVTERPDRTGLEGNCLLIPSDGSTTLYVTTNRSDPADHYLATLPTARLVGALPMTGDQPLRFYQLSGAPSLQSNEVRLPPHIFDTTQGPALQLDSYALAAPNLLQFRWRVLASTGPDLPNDWYEIHAQATAPDGSHDQSLGLTHCQPDHWTAGDTLITWVTFTPTTGSTSAAAEQQQLGVSVYRGAYDETFFTSFGVRFVSAKIRAAPIERLTPQAFPVAPTSPGASVGVILAATGEYLLPHPAP